MSAPVAQHMGRSTGNDAAVPEPATLHYSEWCRKNVPDLSGRVMIVTGANAGLGFWATRAFVNGGATVVMACRSVERGEAARKAILADIRAQERRGSVAGGDPAERLFVLPLDLASFASVREFAASFLADARFGGRLDTLCNNAGAMAQKKRKTADGFDVQIQTNHLGHFLLTQLLFRRLKETASLVEGDMVKDPATDGSHEQDVRVVNQSSSAHRMSGPRINFESIDDGRWTCCFGCCNPGCPCALLCCNGTAPWVRYGQSKLANLLFTLELSRRVGDSNVKAVGCHPGWASTGLQMSAAGEGSFGCCGNYDGPGGCCGWKAMNRRVAQSAADGSLPLIMAAVGPAVRAGAYVGPEKEMKGPPMMTRSNKASMDAAVAAKLWAFSETAVGETFDPASVVVARDDSDDE